jgi:hypothetical protein
VLSDARVDYRTHAFDGRVTNPRYALSSRVGSFGFWRLGGELLLHRRFRLTQAYVDADDWSVDDDTEFSSRTGFGLLQRDRKLQLHLHLIQR